MEQSKAQPMNRRLESLRDWLDSLMVSLAIMMTIFTFFIGTVIVEGDSMIPTLETQQRLLTFPVYYQLDFQDVVVIHRENDTPLVKRVIATEGQTVDIDFTEGIVYVDDVALEEPYAAEPATRYDVEKFMEFPVTVEPGTIFVMGDNRNHSLDSRFQEVGLVDEEQVFGQVVFRIAPFDQFGRVK